MSNTGGNRVNEANDDDARAAQSVFEQFLLNSPYLNTSMNENGNSGGVKTKNTFLAYEERDDFVSGMNFRSSTAPADISEEIYQMARTITTDLPLMATIAEGLDVDGGEEDDYYHGAKAMSSNANNFDLSGFSGSSASPNTRGIYSGSPGTAHSFASMSTPTVIAPPALPKAVAPVLDTTSSEEDMSSESNYTTVMLRNIPNKYTQTSLLEAIDARGFRGLYNFFYLPVDFKNGCNMGYSFTNFVNHESAVAFIDAFKGYQLPAKSSKVCDACWARVQGLKSNIEHYRNSPVNELPDPEYRPLLFQNGNEIAFPRPDPGVIRRSAARRKHSPNSGSGHEHHGGSMRPPGSIFTDARAVVKLFIGGLSAETRDEDIRSHFSKFGDVVDAAVVIDKKTGLSRGFGFCSLANKDAADKVMGTRQHLINGQSVGVRFYQQGK